MSLQATLGNVVGGISLQLNDSINEGDWIELDNNTQGQVKKILGEMALMTGQPREATVIARDDVQCLLVDRKDLEGIIRQCPEIASEISGVLATRRVELAAAREGLDSHAKSQRLRASATAA